MSRPNFYSVCLYCQYNIRPPSATIKPRKSRAAQTRQAYTLRKVSKQARTAETESRIDPRALTRNREETAVPDRSGLSDVDLQHQLHLYSPVDLLRRCFLGPSANIRSRNIANRLKRYSFKDTTKPLELVLSSLHGDSHSLGSNHGHLNSNKTATEPVADRTTTWATLLAQLNCCSHAEDIQRLFTVALQTPYNGNPSTVGHQRILDFFTSDEVLQVLYRKLSRLPPNYSLRFLNLLIARFQVEKIQINPSLLWYSLETAASYGALPAVAKYLDMWKALLQEEGRLLTDKQFRQLAEALTRSQFDSNGSHSQESQASLLFMDGHLCKLIAMTMHSLKPSDLSSETHNIWLRFISMAKAHELLDIEFSSSSPQHSIATLWKQAVTAFIVSGSPQRAWAIFEENKLKLLDEGEQKLKSSLEAEIRTEMFDALFAAAGERPKLGRSELAQDVETLKRVLDVEKLLEEALNTRLEWYLKRLEDVLGGGTPNSQSSTDSSPNKDVDTTTLEKHLWELEPVAETERAFDAVEFIKSFAPNPYVQLLSSRIDRTLAGKVQTFTDNDLLQPKTRTGEEE